MNEGDWARFSCTVKKGTLQWKIGNYTKEEGDALNKIEARGLITVRKYDVVITMDRMYNGPICFRIALAFQQGCLGHIGVNYLYTTVAR